VARVAADGIPSTKPDAPGFALQTRVTIGHGFGANHGLLRWGNGFWWTPDGSDNATPFGSVTMEAMLVWDIAHPADAGNLTVVVSLSTRLEFAIDQPDF
jgi:hypothetical protein